MLNYHHIDFVVDVGANDGGYGRLLRGAGYNGHILSFEPLEEAHRKLLITSKSDTRWAVAPPMALGETKGETTINVAANSTSSSLLKMEKRHLDAAPESEYRATQRVQVCRLDEISEIREKRNIFIKIDTQGYEKNVLEGTSNILDKISGFQLELSILPLYTDQWLYMDALEWFKLQGFELWGLIPGFNNRESGQLLQFDGIFFRHERSVE